MFGHLSYVKSRCMLPVCKMRAFVSEIYMNWLSSIIQQQLSLHNVIMYIFIYSGKYEIVGLDFKLYFVLPPEQV